VTLGSLADLDRESEENIMGVEGRITPDGNNIFVKNEYSVTRSESFSKNKKNRLKKDGEGSVATSVNDDKSDGKSTFLHV